MLLMNGATLQITDNSRLAGQDYQCVWDSRNTKIIYKYFKKVKFLKKLSVKGTRDSRNQIITEFNDKLERCYNDHRNILINEHTNPSEYFEPYRINKLDNMIVLSGLTGMAEHITNQRNKFFTYLAVGTSNVPVSLLDISLASEQYRVNVEDMGWFEPHGNTIRTGSLFPENMPDAIINEIGSFDEPTEGTMFWRVVIDQVAKFLKHFAGETYITVSHIHTFKTK